MKALLPIIEKDSNKPYYLQIYTYIKEQIVSGELGADEKLPSLRDLSKRLKLSITTIAQAYNQLLVEGYIYTKPQSGYYISDVYSHSSRASSPNSVMSSEVFRGNPADFIPNTLKYDEECFDFNRWKKCMNKILTEYSQTLFFKSETKGELGLRTEIAKYLYMSRGFNASPEQIIISANTQQSISLLCSIFSNMGYENVALENPSYLPVRNAFNRRDFQVTAVDVAKNGLQIEELPTNIKALVYLSPSNHMFTGAIMPIKRRYQLINWARDNNSYIIEDDFDSELKLYSNPIPALRSLDSDRVIYLGSFTSTLFAAVGISYVVLPKEMLAEFMKISKGYSQSCSKLEQLTMAYFMEVGAYNTHLKKLRKLYSKKLGLITHTLKKEAADFIELINTASGQNIIIKVHTKKTPDQLINMARSLGVRVVDSENGYLILYYNNLPTDEIEKITSTLIKQWR